MSTAVEVLRRLTSDPKVEVDCPYDGYIIMSVKAGGAELTFRFIGGQTLDDRPSVLVNLADRDTEKTWGMSLIGNWLETVQCPRKSPDRADSSAAIGARPRSTPIE
jgi:hypothetical protein